MFAPRRQVEIRAFDLYPGELVVDNFAGGGGASVGLTQADADARYAQRTNNGSDFTDDKNPALRARNEPR